MLPSVSTCGDLSILQGHFVPEVFTVLSKETFSYLLSFYNTLITISQNIMTTRLCDEFPKAGDIVSQPFRCVIKLRTALHTLDAQQRPGEAPHSPRQPQREILVDFRHRDLSLPWALLPFSYSIVSVLFNTTSPLPTVYKTSCNLGRALLPGNQATARKMQIMTNRSHETKEAGFILWNLNQNGNQRLGQILLSLTLCLRSMLKGTRGGATSRSEQKPGKGLGQNWSDGYSLKRHSRKEQSSFTRNYTRNTKQKKEVRPTQ